MLDDVTRAAQTFLDPVLAGELDATRPPWRMCSQASAIGLKPTLMRIRR
jgi:hypothetical protein